MDNYSIHKAKILNTLFDKINIILGATYTHKFIPFEGFFVFNGIANMRKCGNLVLAGAPGPGLALSWLDRRGGFSRGTIALCGRRKAGD